MPPQCASCWTVCSSMTYLCRSPAGISRSGAGGCGGGGGRRAVRCDARSLQSRADSAGHPRGTTGGRSLPLVVAGDDLAIGRCLGDRPVDLGLELRSQVPVAHSYAYATKRPHGADGVVVASISREDDRRMVGSTPAEVATEKAVVVALINSLDQVVVHSSRTPIEQIRRNGYAINSCWRTPTPLQDHRASRVEPQQGTWPAARRRWSGRTGPRFASRPRLLVDREPIATITRPIPLHPSG